MMRPTIRLALLFSLPTPLIAHAGGLSEKYNACMDRAASNVVQRGVCGQSEVAAQDDRLNKAYQQVMHQLNNKPTEKTALRLRQRSWIKERDYTCNLNGDTVDAACIVTKTAARADELESQVRF